MGQTNIPYGSQLSNKVQSAGLFAANTQRNTTLNRLVGKLPQQAEANDTIRNQSSNYYPIVRCMDLTKKAGDEITFDLINPMGGKPIKRIVVTHYHPDHLGNAQWLAERFATQQGALIVEMSLTELLAAHSVAEGSGAPGHRALDALGCQAAPQLLQITSPTRMVAPQLGQIWSHWCASLAKESDVVG
mgnify:CR=1 FL=1